MRCLVLCVVAVLAARASAQPPDLLAPTDALSPADERKAFTVPAGFDVQLVASEPDIGKPMQMAFDAKGRLWVATSRHYPFAVEPGKGTDKLYVLSHFGDDGKAKKVTLFADNLNIPIGVMPLPDCNGCIVSNINTTCEIVKLTDTNGDGKADKAETLFSGFGVRDTHGMVNSFTLMPDGWVYACHGYLNASKVKGKDGHEIDIQSGNVLRFRLDGSRIEVYSRGQVNPFGLAVDPWFNIYTADCHSKPMTANIPGAVYESFGKAHDGLGFGPNMIGYEPGGTGMCGLAWYDADHFPKTHLGTMYLGNVITNRVNAAKIEWTGATPRAVQQQDLIASTDRWFRPVDIKLGPDGAIYVSDFYNKVIGHYEMPLKHPGRDRDRGRIWRVVKKDSPPKMPFTDLTKEPRERLCELTGSPNFTVRLLATNEIIERNRRGKDKFQWEGNAAIPKDRLGLALSHGNWSSFGGGAFKARDLVFHDDPKELEAGFVGKFGREGATLVLAHLNHMRRALPEFTTEVRKGVLANLDGKPLVQRAAVEALIAHPHADNVKPLVELLPKIQPGDTHLLHATRIALRNSLRAEKGVAAGQALAQKDATVGLLLVDVLLGLPTRESAAFLTEVLVLREDAQLPAVMEHAARYGESEDHTRLANLVGGGLAHPNGKAFGRSAQLLGGLLRGLQASDKRLDDLTRLPPVSAVQMARDPAGAKVYLEAIALLPGVALSRSGGVAHASNEFHTAVVTQTLADDARGTAVDALSRLDPQRALPVLVDILNGIESTALKERAMVALANVPDRRARAEVNVALKGVPYRVAVGAAVNMASTPAGGQELFAGVKAGFVPARVLQDKLVLERLKASKVADWEKYVGDLTRGLPAADAKLAELIKQRGASFGKIKGDKAEGAKLFVKHCGACHSVAGTGGKIAPHLDGVGLRGLERLLEDTLDPNRNVDAAFRARVLNLADGTTKTGLMIKVDGEVLVMADDQGKEFRVPLKDIEKNRETALSPMPANFGDIIPEADFAHLLAYLLDQKVKDAPGIQKSFKPLFNGTDLAGWKGDNWKVENGELTGGRTTLATAAEFGDIALTFECKSTANAHVAMRGASFDLNRAADEWETVRITQVGERTSAWANGKLVLDHARMDRRSPMPKSGAISLRGFGRWRNIQVREIPADEANEILRSHNATGFESVFNGKDFTGWAGPVENYEVTDGAIVCKPKKSGVLHTVGEYADFVARLEFKLPPGGNNGLAIRYPGDKKHAATEGMCEVQILDDTATKYAKLDARQFNGSAYGMAAAHRGYLRAVGEWNVMEVTAKGPVLQIELNGTRILDADVSKITEFKDKQAHPGKDRPSGHFGFCGHNDPVAFRNVQIRKLK